MSVASPSPFRWLRRPFLVLGVCAGSIFLLGDLAHGEEKSDELRTFTEARVLGKQRSTLRKKQLTEPVDTPLPNLAEYANTIQPILARTCVQCHGPDSQEGNVRIDTMNPDLAHGDDVDWWLEVQAVLTNGEMPPPDEIELSGSDRAKIVDWLSNEIQIASIVRRESTEQSSFRRMTRYEFNYALQDLLGLPYDFAKDFPPEASSEEGFQNSSENLHLSVSQLETYQRLVRKALMRATIHGERPQVLHWGITMADAGRIDWAKQKAEIKQVKAEFADNPEQEAAERQVRMKKFRQPHSVPYFKNLTNGRTVPASWVYHRAKHANKPSAAPRAIPETLDQIAILPRGPNERFTIELGNRLPDDGIMRVRVRASRSTTDDVGIPTLQLLFGWQASNEGRAVLPVPNSERAITARPEQAEFYQWDVPLGEIYPRNSVRKSSPMGAMPNPSEYIRLVNRSVSQGSIQIDYVEVAAPVYDHWPPASHQRIFIESDNRGDEQQYAREILTSFMQRAWRRVIRDEEIGRKLRLFNKMRPTCESFEHAVVEVLATVLASPQFLYVTGETRQDQKLAGHELATRLSMFLWCSIPDEELQQLAASGKLHQPDVLENQISRMLADDRVARLPNHFVNQWLNLELLEFRSVPKQLKSLKQAMSREPVALFQEMLETNASVLDFLHADYTMTNERLALHYQLPNVKGNHFRRVSLPADSKRGGLLTQAGLLAMNSSGDDSHPLKRGVWLLERVLSDPPPPPPPAVPEIDLADPEIAKMTLKERIEDHRNHPACLSCHAKIDPWGIAFENFDALGRWRTEVNGKPVDATSRLINGQTLDGTDGLKRFLLESRQDQFVRAMVQKLTTYALGRPLTFADRLAVEQITSEARQQDDGLATIVKQIALSDLFRSR